MRPSPSNQHLPTLTRMPARENHHPFRPRVPVPTPLALGEPMRLEAVSWLQWAEQGMLLLALSLTRIAAR
ncbi:MAG: hypothetical protein M3552_06175 [Planctomycetota bacterium]|nr:hypothetical protein [Planctomycetota bacterium]